MATELSAAVAGLAGGTAAWAVLRRGRAGTGMEEGVLAIDTDGAAVPKGLKGGVVAVLAVPSHQVVMRVLEFPVADAAELACMVELQVDKFSPFPLDQMVVSHEVLALREGASTVLVAAARSSVIRAAGQRFTDAGIRIGRVDTLLLGRWQTLLDAGQLVMEGRETLVLVDGGGVDVLTHEAGVPVALSGLGEVLAPADADTAGELAQEIVHLLMGLEAERGRPSLSAVSVWSEAGEGAPLANALHRSLNQPVRECPLETIPTAVSGTVRRAQHTPPVGAPLDLTPLTWREAGRLQMWRRRVIAAGVLLLGGWLLLAGVVFGVPFWQRVSNERLKAVEGRWQEPANHVRRLRMQVQIIRRYMDRRTSALECLREISLLQPPGVDLTSFTYRKGDGLELIGEADSGALVILYNQRLNASVLFDNVKAGPRTLTRQQRHRFSFEITFKKEPL